MLAAGQALKRTAGMTLHAAEARSDRLLEVLHELPRPDFPAVDVAFGVHRYPLCSTGPRQLERVRNTVEHLAVLHGANPDTSQPARIASRAVRLGIGHVDEIAPNGDPARSAELLPFGNELALLVEDLHAVITAVGDKQAT